jgi:hypothetical protein
VADAIVAGHLLALEVRIEDGGLVGPFCGEGEVRLAQASQSRDDDDAGLGLGMELAWCVHGLPPVCGIQELDFAVMPSEQKASGECPTSALAAL